MSRIYKPHERPSRENHTKIEDLPAETFPARTPKEAITLGEKHYFTGAPCVKGHISPRSAAGRGCVACARLRVAEWHKKNEASILPKKRARYHATAAITLPRSAEYRANNKEKIKSRQKSWRRRNPDRTLELNREWADRNREVIRILQRKRRARLKAAPGTHTVADIEEILRLQRYRCAYCSADLRRVKRHVDHITPLGRRGSNYRRNLQITCAPCNQKKHVADPIDFAQSLGLLL